MEPMLEHIYIYKTLEFNRFHSRLNKNNAFLILIVDEVSHLI
jgi:hypothetical protein